MLLRVYAKCIDGQDEALRRRVLEALGTREPPCDLRERGSRGCRGEPWTESAPRTLGASSRAGDTAEASVRSVVLLARGMGVVFLGWCGLVRLGAHVRVHPL
jgi:hypothetical protein